MLFFISLDKHTDSFGDKNLIKKLTLQQFCEVINILFHT